VPRSRVKPNSVKAMELTLLVVQFLNRHQGLISGLIVFLIGYVTLQYFATKKVDPREPLVVASTLPYLGHILGILQNGSKYYKMIRYILKAQYEAYTISVSNL